MKGTYDGVVLAAHRRAAAGLPNGKRGASDANDFVEVGDLDERSGERREPGSRASLHDGTARQLILRVIVR